MNRKNIKVRTDMFEDTKFKMIDRMEERDLINYVWFRSITLAGKVDKGGQLYLSSTKPYTVETLAIEFNREESEVSLALNVLIELEMMNLSDNNVITVKNFAKHQGIKNKDVKDKTAKKEEDTKPIRQKESRTQSKNTTKKKHKESKESTDKKKDERNCENISFYNNKNIKQCNEIKEELYNSENNNLNNEKNINKCNKEILVSTTREKRQNNSQLNDELYENTQKELKKNSIFKQEYSDISQVTKGYEAPIIIDPNEVEGIALLVDAEQEEYEYIEAIGEIKQIDEEEEICGFIDMEEFNGIIN